MRPRVAAAQIVATVIRHWRSKRIITLAIYLLLLAASAGFSWYGYRLISFRTPPPFRPIYIAAGSEGTEPTKAIARVDDGTISLTTYGKKATVLIDAEYILGCRGHGDTRIQITELPVKDTEFFGKHRVFILEFEPELEIYAGSTVAICEFDYRQIKRSFTARSAQIEYAHRHRTTSSGPFDPLDVILGAAEAVDVSIQGGKTLDPDERYRREISEGQSVNIEWSDELQRNRRDLLLLIIGGVLGIAGAAFLEALKLFLPKE